VRSYELAYVNALWHADFHVGSRRVLTPKDGWSDACLSSVSSMIARVSAVTPAVVSHGTDQIRGIIFTFWRTFPA
jgi:hypothetical protein